MHSERQQSNSIDLLVCCVAAILLLIPPQRWMLRLSRFAQLSASATKSIWDWLAKWKMVETVFTAGWGLMLGAHEYALAVLFLGMASLGAVSSVGHWKPSWKGAKTFASLGIVGACGLMMLVTLANKGSQQWSEIPDYLISRLILPLAPESISKAQAAPNVTHTSKAALLAAQQAVLNSHNSKTTPQPMPEGKVVIALAIGDDDAKGVILREDSSGTNAASFDCRSPFVCYTEDDLRVTPIYLDFNGRKYRRLFFAVENISQALISKPTVAINLSASDISTLKGISLYRPNEGRDNQQHIKVEYNQNETVDLVPYSRTRNPTDFQADLEVADGSIRDFVILFRMFAANLTVHVVRVTIHIIKS